MSEKLRVASMFAGIGGICLGFKQAGFDIVWANDNDAAACNTYRHNFGNDYLIESNIKKINPDNLPDFEVLAAGFPCQPFSLSGNLKGFEDYRGTLFFEIANIIKKKHPEVVFLENVKNLIEHDNGKTFLVIYNTLIEFGYFVRYQVMSPITHGNIPHIRDRIFIVAFKNLMKCNAFTFPDPIPLTLKIGDLVNPKIQHSDCYYYADEDYYYKELLQKVKLQNVIYKIALNCVFRKPYQACPTLLASMGSEPTRIPIVFDDFGVRSLTPRECLDFQGFPQDYSFPAGTKLSAAYKQTGNSVCVPVVRRIAEQIVKVMDIVNDEER